MKEKVKQSKKLSKNPKSSTSRVGKINKDMRDFLEVDDVAHGDESGTVKPWLGAIFEPSDHPPINNTKPDFTYEIDFVYGYRTEDVRMNLYYNIKR